MYTIHKKIIICFAIDATVCAAADVMAYVLVQVLGETVLMYVHCVLKNVHLFIFFNNSVKN